MRTDRFGFNWLLQHDNPIPAEENKKRFEDLENVLHYTKAITL
jgi:hypothetical protein